MPRVRRRLTPAMVAGVAAAATLALLPSTPAGAAVDPDVQFADRFTDFIYMNVDTIWQVRWTDDHSHTRTGVLLDPDKQLTGYLGATGRVSEIVPTIEFSGPQPLDDGGRFHLIWTDSVTYYDEFIAVDPGPAGLAPDGLWRLETAESDMFVPLSGRDVTLAEIDAALGGVNGGFITYAPLAPRMLEWATLGDGILWMFTPKPLPSQAPPTSQTVDQAARDGLHIATTGFLPGDTVTATVSGPVTATMSLPTDAVGDLRTVIPLPAGATAGAYRITLSSALPYDQTFDFALVADAAVTAADPELAATGAPSSEIAVVAATALLAGVGLLLLRRRRARIR